MKRLTRKWPEGSGIITGRAICEFNHCPEDVGCNECVYGRKNNRLATIEDILGDDYDLKRLRELVEVDRDGRCVVLPCKIGSAVYSVRHQRVADDEYRMSFHDELSVIEQKFGLIHADCVGKTVFLTREAAEDALKKEGLK